MTSYSAPVFPDSWRGKRRRRDKKKKEGEVSLGVPYFLLKKFRVASFLLRRLRSAVEEKKKERRKRREEKRR